MRQIGLSESRISSRYRMPYAGKQSGNIQTSRSRIEAKDVVESGVKVELDTAGSPLGEVGAERNHLPYSYKPPLSSYVKVH